MFENILKGDSAKRLTEIGSSELIVGIPTFKNAKTVARVVRAAADGLDAFAHLNPLIAIVDGLSSDQTLNAANNVVLPPRVRRVSGLYFGANGKGSGVRAVFEMARALKARAALILEADVQSIEPQWIHQLAAPILAGEYDYVVPQYARALPDNAVTDLMAYPLTRMLYGADLRQPMGGEFAVSGELAARWVARDVWETDVAKHGIDIWLTTAAVNENVRMCQTRLGVKSDLSHEGSLSLDPTFVQAVGTLFRLLDIYRKRWREVTNWRTVPIYKNGGAHSPRDAKTENSSAEFAPAVPIEISEAYAEAFRSAARRNNRTWRTVLAPTNLQMIRALAEQPEGPFRVSAELWARCVFDFAVVYNKGEGDPDKVAGGILPIYLARLATILKASAGKPEAIERAIQQQADVFARSRDYLIQRWDTYVPWMFEGVR